MSQNGLKYTLTRKFTYPIYLFFQTSQTCLHACVYDKDESHLLKITSPLICFPKGSSHEPDLLIQKWHNLKFSENEIIR